MTTRDCLLEITWTDPVTGTIQKRPLTDFAVKGLFSFCRNK